MRIFSVFIVRPFGVKNNVDFDRVERDLIRPALARLKERHAIDVIGGTTGEIVKQGTFEPTCSDCSSTAML